MPLWVLVPFLAPAMSQPASQPSSSRLSALLLGVVVDRVIQLVLWIPLAAALLCMTRRSPVAPWPVHEEHWRRALRAAAWIAAVVLLGGVTIAVGTSLIQSLWMVLLLYGVRAGSFLVCNLAIPFLLLQYASALVRRVPAAGLSKFLDIVSIGPLVLVAFFGFELWMTMVSELAEAGPRALADLAQDLLWYVYPASFCALLVFMVPALIGLIVAQRVLAGVVRQAGKPLGNHGESPAESPNAAS